MSDVTRHRLWMLTPGGSSLLVEWLSRGDDVTTREGDRLDLVDPSGRSVVGGVVSVVEHKALRTASHQWKKVLQTRRRWSQPGEALRLEGCRRAGCPVMRRVVSVGEGRRMFQVTQDAGFTWVRLENRFDSGIPPCLGLRRPSRRKR